MKTWKRALALVLALVMALSLVALPSFAEGEEESAGDTGMPYIKDHGGTVIKDGLGSCPRPSRKVRTASSC